MSVNIPRPALQGRRAVVTDFAGACLAMPCARRNTGQTTYVDGGVSIMA